MFIILLSNHDYRLWIYSETKMDIFTESKEALACIVLVIRCLQIPIFVSFVKEYLHSL